MSSYIHGTEPPEQHRLVELNRLTNAAFLAFLDLEIVPAHARVLEVGSGLGILAGQVAAARPGTRVAGVELSRAQLGAATRTAGVSYIQADAHALPFAAATFDLAYARFLLEHVHDPLAVLAEMRRVLAPGGRIAVMENDISLARFDPPCPRFGEVWSVFGRLQTDLGGDGTIGRRLFALLKGAGFRDIELSVQPEVHWHGSPAWVAWVTNIIGNVESARNALVGRDYCTAADIEAAVFELAALIEREDASAIFVWNRARARR